MKKLNIRLFAMFIMLSCGLLSQAEVSYYECSDLGFISHSHKTVGGTVVTTNRGTEIMLVKDNALKTLVSGPGAGMYTNASKDGKYIGFKKIDNQTGQQAPAILDVITGTVSLLEDYSRQCGQVSFADDGTMAYTVGNNLIIRKGDSRRTFALGLYTNIANISPNGAQVAYCDMDGNSYLLTVSTGDIVKFASVGAYCPIWSPDGKKVAMQIVNGDAACFDFSNGSLYNLGAANSVAWTDDSQDLVVSRSERVNDMQVKGAEVLLLSYKGDKLAVLESLSEDTPVSAAVDGNVVTVSYANGERRGLQAVTFNGTLRNASPAKVRTLFKAGKQRLSQRGEDNFRGKVRPDYSAMTKEEAQELEAGMDGNSTKAPMRKGNDIGLTAIPYINQVWDTPACGGSAYAYGYICCAPTSSCMMLAWYGRFQGREVWTASRHSWNPAGGTNYSWFIAKQYTSMTGYTFNKYVSGQGGYWGYSNDVAGGYGYMWGYGSPASMMANFHKNNGVQDSWFESSWGVMQRECNANRPYVICLANGTGGHVVMAFRCDQIAANDGSSTWWAGGSFICHDPYGDYNSSSYPNWDGRYSSYDWPGINNGRANIGAFHWGCVTLSQGASPEINVSTDYAYMQCNRWEHPTYDINVSTSNVNENIAVWADSQDDFSISTGELGSGGGSFRITFNNTDWYHFKETWIHVRANNVQKDIHVVGYVQGTAVPELGEGWNLSVQRGTNWNKGYDASQIRNFCYLNGKLYCVYQNSKIIVLNAQTGDYLGDLKLNGVGEGTLALTDVKAVSGKIVACNLAVASNGDHLCIYKWDNDNAEPKKILYTQDLQGVDRIGDCMEVVGGLDYDAWFAFMREMTDDTRIVEYHQVSEYNFEPKYTLAMDTNGNKLHVGATARAYPWGGPFWVDGNAIVPSYLCWNGYAGVSPSATCPTNGQTQGASHHEFYYQGWKHAANLVFRGDANYTGAKLRIERDLKGNFSECDEVREYPWDGLGGNANTNGTGEVIINTNEADFVEGWVLSTTQGLAYYRTGNVPGHDVQPVNKPALWFSERDVEMRGKVGETTQRTIRIEGENLRGNIYLTTHDAHDGRSTNALQIWPTELSGPGEVTVSYKADDYDSNWIWIKAASDGADDAYTDIQAENYRDPAIYVDGDPNFSCFADQPQTHEFRVYGRDIKGWAGAALWGDNPDHNNQFELWHSWGLKENTTVYFNNNRSHWDRVYVWIWNKDNPYYNYLGVDYPGIQVWDRGDGYYEFTFRPEDLGQNLGIMFNDGYENGQERQKTDDGYVLDHAVYYTGGNSAWWRIPGRRQPLHCDFDGSLYVKYRPYSVGQHNSNFFVATDNKWPNYDVALNGFCNGMSGVSDISGANNLTVQNGNIIVGADNVKDIAVYSMSGVMVAKATDSNVLSVSHLPKAKYIVTVTTADGVTRAKLTL